MLSLLDLDCWLLIHTMEKPLDINNEMILMRKEIKRAKTWVVSRLVKRIRNLRNKKGNIKQMEKNGKRADRLVNEIELLKDLAPDEIFKALLQSDYDVAELVKSTDLPLRTRCFIRFSSIGFISERMKEIKDNISKFHSAHSGEVVSKAIKVAERLAKMTNNKKDFEDFSSDLPSVTLKSNESIQTNVTDSGITQTAQGDVESKHFSECEVQSDVEKGSNDSSKDSDIEVEFGETEIISKLDECNNNCYSQNVSMSGKTIAATNNIPEEEDFVIDTTAEGYQVVLPPYYANQMRKSESKIQSTTYNIVSESKGAEDITEILPNIGEGFESPNEDTKDDLEYEELVASGIKTVQRRYQPNVHTNWSDTEAQKSDGFFICESNNFSNVKKKTWVEDDSKTEIKSSFIHTLWNSEQKGKKKNRPSQRVRKRSHLKGDKSKTKLNALPSRPHKKFKDKPSSVQTTKKGREASVGKLSVQSSSLHPSWEASRRRKQEQTKIVPFQGKRICFNDSD